jgi:hypothetical protein
MSAFIRLAFLTIPGALLSVTLWATVFEIIAPAWMINLAGAAGTIAAAALAYEYKRKEINNNANFKQWRNQNTSRERGRN